MYEQKDGNTESKDFKVKPLIVPKNTSSKKILIIEDDLCLQTILCKAIKAIDPEFEIHWAVNGQEALDLLEVNQYRVIIADYLLPGFLNGLWIWDRCRDEYPSSSFVLMSGLSVEEFLKLTSGQKQCPSFLAKPFMKSEFCGIIERALDTG